MRQAKPGKGGGDDLKPFVGTQRVTNNIPERLASHPEASLALRLARCLRCLTIEFDARRPAQEMAQLPSARRASAPRLHFAAGCRFPRAERTRSRQAM